MSSIELSYARETNFTVTMNEFPKTEFFLTDSFIPSISLAEVNMSYSGIDTYRPDNGIRFDPMTIGFLVDERWESYFEIFDWMHLFGNPQGPRIQPIEPSSLLITILDNNKNPIINIEFVSVWPLNLGQIVLNTQGTNEALTCDLTLRYDYIRYTRLDGPLPTSLPE